MENKGLYGSICLSDIPKELITTGTNGKKYLNITIDERREPSRFGNTHYIKAYCRKEQRQEGVNYYIGELKPSQQSAQPQQVATPAPAAAQAAQNHDDLPF